MFHTPRPIPISYPVVDEECRVLQVPKCASAVPYNDCIVTFDLLRHDALGRAQADACAAMGRDELRRSSA